ncbi:MAG TPA: hypothetical protein VFT22_45270 [Kofleriaceae bacterium]|nr:hypothetical protein [Kofleriaceae bacterium]
MRRPSLSSPVGAGILALVGTLAPASAAPQPAPSPSAPPGARPTIVLEAHVGQRPGNADAIMAPLYDELEARGFAARPASILPWIGPRAPRPGALDRGLTAAQLHEAADAGFAAYTRGKFAEAAAALGHALDQVHHHPALLVLDTTHLAATFKILVGLALSQARLGDGAGSTATMLELIRTFRGQPITRADYGPLAEQLYRAAARQVRAMARGELAITVDHDQAVIFVDGQIRGVGKAALGDLIPGVYRVFVQVPATAGRLYELEVVANQRTSLHVDWELDSSLWVSERWIGFLFAGEADRVRQAGLAGKLARRWSDGDLIAVVGTAQRRGRPSVTGTLYDLGGNVVRSAVVVLDDADGLDASPGPDGGAGGGGGAGSDGGEGSDAPDGAGGLKLRALARFLDDGIAGDGVSEVADAAPVAARSSPGPIRPSSGASLLVSQLLVSAGTAALVAGGVLYALDRDAGIAPTAVDPGRSSTRNPRSTAPAGIAVGSVGIAVASMGVWLWAAHSGRSSAPMLGLARSGGFLGWAGVL